MRLRGPLKPHLLRRVTARRIASRSSFLRFAAPFLLRDKNGSPPPTPKQSGWRRGCSTYDLSGRTIGHWWFWDELIARRSTAREMRQLADRQGFTTLADDGLRRVLDGSTSLEEVGRVVDLTDRM